MFGTPIYIIIFILIIGYLAKEFLFSKKEKVIERQHEYFDVLWLWPKGSHTCWEANININGESIGIHTEDDEPIEEYREPNDSEVSFCIYTVKDLSGLYHKALPAIREAWKDWGSGKVLAEEWSLEFLLDGFSVPINGDVNNYWGVVYYSKTAGHYFCIGFNNGTPELESVDG